MILHPIIFSWCPVIYLYVHNSSELALPMLILTFIGVALLTLACWALVKLRQRDDARAALITSTMILLFFSFGHLYNRTTVWAAVIPHYPVVFFTVWLLVLIGLVVLAACWRYDEHRLTDGINAAALVLFAITVVSLVQTEWKHVRSDQATGQIAPTFTSADFTGHPLSAEKRPNFYYIILDSYAREDMLLKFFDRSNHDFIAYLRRKGFYVAEKSTANYDQTIDSIPSSMNFSYVDQIAKEVGKYTSDRHPLARYIANSRTRELVKHFGYKFIAFPSEYALMNLPSDVNMKGFDNLSDFENSLIDTTPLMIFKLLVSNSALDVFEQHRRMLQWQFANIPKANRIDGPFFAFAHILAPHAPFVFDADGHPTSNDVLEARKRGRHWVIGRDYTVEEAKRYADEVIYLNTLTEKMIDRILATAKRPTMIVLQADHGPGYLPISRGDKARINVPEKFGILNAYYFPDGTPKTLYPEITPVNSFRVIFNHYFGTHFSRLPDHHYFTPLSLPYLLEPMDAELAHPKPPLVLENSPTGSENAE